MSVAPQKQRSGRCRDACLRCALGQRL